jgi:hypothetical protein
MRVSTKRDDAGFTTDSYLYRVTIDGVNASSKRFGCVMADEERGVVGFHDYEEFSCGEFRYFERRGAVVITKVATTKDALAA